ncbi:MAG: hypothetical protein AMDU4_FER2C00177G0004 [Ferroplasma sp. Type II]|uniref:hypothetical protein n=1 Tax=Ferroplasma sp. Type II TaxID=261388 RepID=UPI0003896F05|nr:hypothetical protein [Ferroplasma sp. Type II]EQB71737.1 MAG: hypothetical protein AMDU4_FER2C00177G0004 [Ferroplasma sp. Type II]
MDNRKLIALRSFIIAAGATAAASFVGVFAVMIGASAVEMGWLQSSSNSLSNLGQILWGRISDRVRATNALSDFRKRNISYSMVHASIFL